MKKEMKLNASARKFVARTRLSHSGFFEQKPLRKISSQSITPTQDIESTQNITNTTVDLYFSTPAGGKNVISTNQSSNSTQQILMSCNTSVLAPSTLILKTILTLCDGSEIKALQGSNDLNITTDPSLKCINDEFNSLCGEGSSLSTGAIIAIGAVLLIVGGCCYGAYKHCCEGNRPPPSPSSEASKALLRELDRRRWERAGDNLAKVCMIL